MERLRMARVACASAVILTAAIGVAAAQDATPPSESALGAAIYPGVCGEGGDLGVEPVLALGLIGPAVDDEPGVPEVDEVRGLSLSPPVVTLEETIGVGFDDLLGDPHAVVVGVGERAAEGVACGQLGGVIDGGRLAIGLRPLSDERYYGVAVLEDAGSAAGVGEGELLVTVYLFQEQGPSGPLGIGATPTVEAVSTP